MGALKGSSKKTKIIKYISIAIMVFIIFFIGSSYAYNKKNVPDVVEAGDLSESLMLMSEKSSANIALDHKKKLIEAERARLAEMEKEEKEEDEEENYQDEDKKKAFLTFDDGPSEKVTLQILDVLKEYDIKATFFVVGNFAEKLPHIIKRIDEDGHTIGNHSYSHRYNYIYKRTSNFIEELEKTEKVLKTILGEEYETKIIRFPGGSFGDNKIPFIKAAQDKGYTHYDWNSLNGDAEGYEIPNEKLVQRFKSTYKGQEELIVLMHDLDSKYTTPESLPYIIEFLQENDYEFYTLE